MPGESSRESDLGADGGADDLMPDPQQCLLTGQAVQSGTAGAVETVLLELRSHAGDRIATPAFSVEAVLVRGAADDNNQKGTLRPSHGSL